MTQKECWKLEWYASFFHKNVGHSPEFFQVDYTEQFVATIFTPRHTALMTVATEQINIKCLLIDVSVVTLLWFSTFADWWWSYQRHNQTEAERKWCCMPSCSRPTWEWRGINLWTGSYYTDESRLTGTKVIIQQKCFSVDKFTMLGLDCSFYANWRALYQKCNYVAE